MSKVAVIGGGTMGCSIALAIAAAGFQAIVVEPDSSAQARARERMTRDAQRMGSAEAPAKVSWSTDIPALPNDVDLAIEAVPEDLELKERVFLALEKVLPQNAVLATNTSSLSVAEIAQALANPGRVIGLHFFNPANVMKLVEVVAAKTSDEGAVQFGKAFVESLGKTAVITADTPGFIVNRVARPYYLHALNALSEGLGEAAELDALARGVGFKMGPFELMDLIGLDVNLATTRSVFSQTGEDRFAPVQLQEDLVAHGQLGRKSGRGFYDYSQRVPESAPNDGQMATQEMDTDEVVAVLGYGGLADDVLTLLEPKYQNISQIALDEQLDDLDIEATTIVIDCGDGASDRTELLAALERRLPQETVLFADAYTTDCNKLIQSAKHPERIVGYGCLGGLEGQAIIEIADLDATGDDALGLAEELFSAMGKHVQLVGNGPGLFLGRTVASIINEAVYVVQEHVASPDDVDLAMRLGTNYPLGPMEWGREIGAARIARILTQLAHERGQQYAPARALWMLNVATEEDRELNAEMMAEGAAPILDANPT